MTDTPPQWAIEMAREEIAREYDARDLAITAQACRGGSYDNTPDITALARRIARTETPPVDPAEEVVAAMANAGLGITAHKTAAEWRSTHPKRFPAAVAVFKERAEVKK